MAQNAHQPIAVTPLHFAHIAPLETHQTRVREIERNGNAGDPVRREPFLRKPAMRPETDIALGQFEV